MTGPRGRKPTVLEARGVEFAYPGLPVLNGVDVSVRSGETVALLGPSGCGKSTLFHIIAGLLAPDSGTVDYPLHQNSARPPVGYMLQKDLLLPWLTLRDNALLPATAGPRDGREGRTEAARHRLGELLPVFGLEGFVDYYPGQLSGGMRQRGALLRTCVADPDILLLDEPLGALDAITRRTLQGWIRSLMRSLGMSVLLVTHDVEEAVLLADRVVVLSARPGRVVRTSTIDLPEVRDASLLTDPGFHQLASELLEALEEASEAGA